MSLVFDRVSKNVTVPTVDGSLLNIQDLHNETRIWQALHANMDERNFLDSSGKQSLGGSAIVGITIEIKNTWMLGFEAAAGPAVHACVVVGGNLTARQAPIGLATSTGTTTLTDTDALFIRCAFQTGNVVKNITDGSEATITQVDSETVLQHTALTGGGSNDWQIGDEWLIESTHPIFPTEFIHVTISQDAAPVSIVGLDQIDILRKIFLNRAVTTLDAPGPGQKTIDFYDDDQTTIIDSIVISADGNIRTNP